MCFVNFQFVTAGPTWVHPSHWSKQLRMQIRKKRQVRKKIMKEPQDYRSQCFYITNYTIRDDAGKTINCQGSVYMYITRACTMCYMFYTTVLYCYYACIAVLIFWFSFTLLTIEVSFRALSKPGPFLTLRRPTPCRQTPLEFMLRGHWNGQPVGLELIPDYQLRILNMEQLVSLQLLLTCYYDGLSDRFKMLMIAWLYYI